MGKNQRVKVLEQKVKPKDDTEIEIYVIHDDTGQVCAPGGVQMTKAEYDALPKKTASGGKVNVIEINVTYEDKPHGE
jgi:hypothetical protein